ncbi:hypothetical protein [Sphingomonas xinjiangensis]|nr:hypothetical protein [Sphingomonas xinjiangensis]
MRRLLRSAEVPRWAPVAVLSCWLAELWPLLVVPGVVVPPVD